MTAKLATLPEAGRGNTAQGLLDEVLHGLDNRDRNRAFAMKQFAAEHAKALAETVEGPVIARLESAEVRAEIVAFHRARIEAEACQRRARLAGRRFELAVERVRQAVREHESVAPHGDWSVDPHRLLVYESDREPERIAFAQAQQIVAAETATVAGPGVAVKALEDRPDLRAFLADVQEFVVKGGRAARLVLTACLESPDAARRLSADEDAAPPARFFAGLALALAPTRGGH